MTLQDYFIEHVGLKNEWAYDLNEEKLLDLKPESRVKVWWRCERGHEWRAAPDSRVRTESGCPICTEQPEISDETDNTSVESRFAELWHPTMNGALKYTDVSRGSRKRVWWQCQKGHAWQAAVYSVNSGTSCPYCSGRQAISGETDLATTHPHLSGSWSARNTLSMTEVTAGSHKKVWWVCEHGHEWESMVVSFVKDGCGCPYCAGKRAITGETDLVTVHPDIMTEWDWEKNEGLDPTQILPSSHDKVWWRCERGHAYQAVVFSRTREKGSGCPYCTGRKVLAGFNDLGTLKPKLAAEWHQPLNGELTPQDVTLGSNKKVWWCCGERHIWQAAIYSRTRKRGAGCPICTGAVKRRGQAAMQQHQPRRTAQHRAAQNQSTAGINA